MTTKVLETKDGGQAIILNETGLTDEDVFAAFREQVPEHAAMINWASSVSSGRVGSITNRDMYVAPDSIFGQFQIAQHASENDDVVSGVLESTESLAFSKMSFETEDEDEENIWNQLAGDLDLDSLFRKMWRETFIYSQFYAAIFWGKKTYKVKGPGRKKTFSNLTVPLGIRIIDPLKVVPLDSSLFGKERLIYIPDPSEADRFDEILAGKREPDPVVSQLIIGKYEVSRSELKAFQAIGNFKSSARFYELNTDNVWRHTATRPDYKNFADCRLKSIFELLDLKHQLKNMDRAHLLGATNFIVLVKKGSDEIPAKQHEVNRLGAQMKQSSRIPVIVTDHRTEIEIITPKTDKTLNRERYDTLDERISTRLYKIYATSRDDSIKLARVVARGMESARHMIMRDFEKAVIKQTFERNDLFTDEPELVFHPKRIALDFDNNIATYMQDARDRGDISRATLLEQLDISEKDEARKRTREKAYEKIFTPTNVPFSGGSALNNTANGNDNNGSQVNVKAAGRRGGGNKAGGGSNANSKAPNQNPVRSK